MPTKTVHRRLVLFLGSLLVLLLGSAPPAYAQQSVPALTGRVVDQGEVLSATTEATLTTLLQQHEDSTSNQLAVLTITSLAGEPIETYALRVAETWGLGTAARDNGVLLVVAVEDRELRIEVGDGLQGVLTDAMASRIIRNGIVPHFREGDYDGGVLTGVERILGVLNGTYTPPESSAADDKPPFLFGLIFLIVPSIFFFSAIVTPGCARWFIFLFLFPFFAVGAWAITGTLTGILIVLGIYVVLFIGASFHPKVRALHKKIRAAKKTGSTVKVGPFTVSSSSSGGGWSSGGSSFSGGGGSFSGGGASGSW